MLKGSDIFLSVVEQGLYQDDQERTDLMRKVWAPTPWVVDVYTGGFKEEFGREMRIRKWCADRFGQEAFVIGGVDGSWQRGSATINGRTWMGFATEAMMNDFLAEWGDNQTGAAC